MNLILVPIKQETSIDEAFSQVDYIYVCGHFWKEFFGCFCRLIFVQVT
jgi:hypothetical protein